MSIPTRNTYISLALVLLSLSCKKDTLHFNKVEQQNSKTTNRLNAIAVSGNNVYIAGGDRFNSTTILISHDMGNNWEAPHFSQTDKSLYGISTNKAGIVFACGFDGKLLWSTDKGNNWQFKQLNNWQPYKDIAYINDNKRIAIIGISYNSGGIVLLDAAGEIVHYDSTGTEYNDLEMITPSTGFITGYGVVLKTTDEGNNWALLDIKNDNFTAISGINEYELWVCGAKGSIHHTINGGKDWIKLRNGNDLTKPQYALHDILFTDSNNGWAVGENGLVIYTDDAGEHWMEYDRFTTETLRSIALLPDGKFIVCGDNGTVYKLWK